MSKQWKTSIFNKESVIEIQELEEKKFKSLVKKIPIIKKVVLFGRISNEMFGLIGQYCPRIRSLDFYYYRNNNNSWQFLRMYGHKLEELRLYENWNRIGIDDYLVFCPNLKKVLVKNVSVLYRKDKDFLPKLEFIRNLTAKHLYIQSQGVIGFKILTDKYSRTLKTLNVSLWRMTEEELNKCIESISRLKNLRQLKLEIGEIRTTEPLDDCLSLISQKCNKLLKLDLCIEKEVQLSEKFFDMFYNFETIRELKIELSHRYSIVRKCRMFQTLQTTL